MAAWLPSVGIDDTVVMCTISRGEILFGFERLPRGRRRIELEEKARKVFASLPCEPILPAAGDQYANVKSLLERRGQPIDQNDLWIAATALAMQATLVTRDSDFQRIEGLNVIEP